MSTHSELEILSSGAFASIQDGGRYGFRRIGVPWAGVLDRRLMRIANALVDNPGDRAPCQLLRADDGEEDADGRGDQHRRADLLEGLVEGLDRRAAVRRLACLSLLGEL